MFEIDLADGAILRPLAPWRAPEFLAHIDRARETVDPWVPWATRSTDLPSAQATLQRYADLTAKDAGGVYGLWQDGTLVGGVMFVSFNATTGVCELGCWLEPAAYGRGLVTRGCRVILDWAFTERGLHRAEWKCRPDNIPSRNAARRLGFTLEGTLREDFDYRGRRHDTEIWAILAREWPPHP